MKKIIRTIIILAVVVGLGAVGYKYFLAKPAATTTDSGLATTAGVSTDPSVAATADANVTTSSNQFLSLLLDVQSIKLDSTLFASPSFTTLQDLSRPIVPDTNPGRANPFAPLGQDTTAQASAQVTTSNPSSITASATTLNGVLVGADTSTTRWFEYGTTPTLGIMTTPRSQSAPGAFAEQVTQLAPNTTYYAEAAANVDGETIYGTQVSWKTAATR